MILLWKKLLFSLMLNGLWTESCIGMYIVLVMRSEFAIDNLYPELKSVSDAGTEFYL